MLKVCLLAHFKFTLICNSYLRPHKYRLSPPPPPPRIVHRRCCSVCVFRVVSLVQCFVLYCSIPYTFCSCKILLYICSCKLYIYPCCKSKDYFSFYSQDFVSSFEGSTHYKLVFLVGSSVFKFIVCLLQI